MNQIYGSLSHHHRHKLIQNFTMNDSFLQLWHPIVRTTTFRWFLFGKSFNNSLAAPNTLMRFTRKNYWQRNILDGLHFAGLFIAFIFARFRYEMNRCLWPTIFFAEFHIFFRQESEPAIVEEALLLDAKQRSCSLWKNNKCFFFRLGGNKAKNIHCAARTCGIPRDIFEFFY